MDVMTLKMSIVTQCSVTVVAFKLVPVVAFEVSSI